MGRARIARAIPDSSSPETAGDATKTAASESTQLNMNITRMRSCETIVFFCASDRGCPPLRHHYAESHDRNRGAHLLDLAEEVRVEEHHGPSVAEAADDLAHVVAADRVERARRLVEQDDCGIVEQRHAEAEPLLHPLRER